jgi:hypothetical protein
MARPERLELPTFWFVARRSDPTELRARFFILPHRPRSPHPPAKPKFCHPECSEAALTAIRNIR